MYPSIRTLKLRQTSVSDASMTIAMRLLPNLQRLDVSFTGVRRLALLPNSALLEKLSLTSTKVSSADLLKAIPVMTSLKTLAIGALGRGEGSAAAVSNSSAMTMTDETLRQLTTKLMALEHLENVNLAGNLKLGTVTHSALTSFVANVGRNCKVCLYDILSI